MLRGKISENSDRISSSDALRFQRVQGAIRLRKEAILYNLSIKLSDLVELPSLDYGVSVGRGVFFSGLFKPLYETIGLILLIFALFTLKGQGFDSISDIGALLFLLYRMIPALQQVFVNLGRVNNNISVLKSIDFNVPHKDNKQVKNQVVHVSLSDVVVEDDTGLMKLPDVDFCIGKINIIMGPSGVGKSTALDCISGVINHKGGVSFLDVNGQALINKGLCGYAPQFPELFSGLTMRESLLVENIDMEVAQKLKVDELLIRNSVIDGEKAELSGGQKKRIGLLRCLSIDRPVLLLDEPTSGLDTSNSEIVWNILEEKSKSSLVIVTSHEIPPLNKNNYEIKLFKHDI